jgi:hypothetical protein
MTDAVYPLLRYAYVNYHSENSTDGKFLALPGFWTEKVRELGRDLNSKSTTLVAMDFFSLTYFLEKRREPWFYRGVDDSIMNLPRLPSFLGDLNSRFDPLTDVVVRGDCVMSKGYLFIQGGSGFICSRAAARRLNNITAFMKVWALAEDVTMGLFLDSLGIGVLNSCSGAFMGHGTVLASSTRRTVKCPTHNTSRVPIHLERVRDLLVYHKKDFAGLFLQSVLPLARSLFKAPESLRWFLTSDDFTPQMCTREGGGWVFHGMISGFFSALKRVTTSRRIQARQASYKHTSVRSRTKQGGKKEQTKR